MSKFFALMLGFCFLGRAEPIVNGDFESPGLPENQSFRYLNSGETFLPGWVVTNDTVGEPPYYAKLPRTNLVHHGRYGVALGQGSGLKTTLSTEVGAVYELSFWLRSQPLDCATCRTPSPLRVTVGGVVTNLAVIEGWSERSVVFTAAGPATELAIFNPSPAGDFKGYGLDDVRVVKIAESAEFRIVSVGRVDESTLSIRFYAPSPGEYVREDSFDLNAWEMNSFPVVRADNAGVYEFRGPAGSGREFFRISKRS